MRLYSTRINGKLITSEIVEDNAEGRQIRNSARTISPNGSAGVMWEYWECFDVCEDIWGEICVGNPFNPDGPNDMYCEVQWLGQTCEEECFPTGEEWPEPDYCDDPANWEECWGSNPDPGSDDADEIDLSFCSGISATDRANIENTIEHAASLNCATLAVNNALAGQQGMSLGMCVNETTGSGTYNAATKSITFKTSFAATHVETMRHEVFHAYQDNIAYTNGIGNYSLGQPGFSNIEFENALFLDIMMLSGSSATALNYSTNSNIKLDYTNWINTLTNNGTQYPDFSANWSVYETKYFEFMEEFRSSNPNYNAPIINTLAPDALKKIFNGLQPNCGN